MRFLIFCLEVIYFVRLLMLQLQAGEDRWVEDDVKEPWSIGRGEGVEGGGGSGEEEGGRVGGREGSGKQKPNHCKLSRLNMVLGKVRYTRSIISINSGCIFPAGKNQQVVPIKMAGDKIRFDPITRITTFYRGQIRKYKGRAEMCFCFSTPSILKNFNKYQIKFLSHIKAIADYCPNSVHTTRKTTRAEYGLQIRLPGDTTGFNDAIVAQWHGRPRRLVYKDVLGKINTLNVNLSTISTQKSLNEAIQKYNHVLDMGGSFDQGGYPPMAVHIKGSKFAVTARYDPRMFTDKTLRCHVDVENYPLNQVKRCGVIEETVIYRGDINSLVGKWRRLDFQVNWGRIGELSGVQVFVDLKKVAVWEGMLGRNDEAGVYMKYGIYAPRETYNVSVQVKDAFSNVYNQP